MKPVDEESVADEFPSLQEHVLLRSERVENKHARKHIQDGHFEREVETEMWECVTLYTMCYMICVIYFEPISHILGINAYLMIRLLFALLHLLDRYNDYD